MKRGNIRAHIAELRAAFLLFMLLRMAGGDWDDDGKKIFVKILQVEN